MAPSGFKPRCGSPEGPGSFQHLLPHWEPKLELRILGSLCAESTFKRVTRIRGPVGGCRALSPSYLTGEAGTGLTSTQQSPLWAAQ